jgi:nucleotide-binding universal stress UspA family protein
VEPIKHIMIATDGSDLSLKAAAFGGEMARALGATVSIVMVLDERSVIPEVWGAVGLPGIGGL